MEPRLCLVCHADIDALRRQRHAKYCSSRCANVYNRAQYEKNPGLTLSSSTIGALAELMVSTDLMRRGYEVFRALSPACSCDLAILKDGCLLRIEVRTAHRYRKGLMWAKNKTQDRHDHYALVLHSDNQIVYEPPLP